MTAGVEAASPDMSEAPSERVVLVNFPSKAVKYENRFHLTAEFAAPVLSRSGHWDWIGDACVVHDDSPSLFNGNGFRGQDLHAVRSLRPVHTGPSIPIADAARAVLGIHVEGLLAARRGFAALAPGAMEQRSWREHIRHRNDRNFYPACPLVICL